MDFLGRYNLPRYCGNMDEDVEAMSRQQLVAQKKLRGGVCANRDTRGHEF
jgi:hypothetical protein